MKFLYEYRTKNNELKEGSVNAADRDAAFSLLKKQGIRPARMVEAPGFFNKLFGKGKRWMPIAILLVVVGSLTIHLLRMGEKVETVVEQIESKTRHQVFGDQAFVERNVREGWKDVFADEGERFLASFAMPGIAPIRRTVEWKKLEETMNRKVGIDSKDSIEVRQIKSLVQGMKEEMQRFVKAGGSVRRYAMRLVQRQEQEMDYYQRAKREVETAVKNKMQRGQLLELWEKRNEGLRMMGIKLLALPE